MKYAESSGAHLFPFGFVGWQSNVNTGKLAKWSQCLSFIRAVTALKIHSEVQHALPKIRLSEENLMLLIMESKCFD